jgi:cell division protein FtsQ
MADELKKRSPIQGNRRVQPPTEEPSFNVRETVVGLMSKRLLWIVLGSLLALFVLFNLIWQHWVMYQWAEFINTKYADRTELYNILQVKVPTYHYKMSEIDPAFVVQELKQHPWVSDAVVSKHWNGMMEVNVIEKMPVLLALNAQGYPAYYLDENAYPMPYRPGTDFNVPLVRGRLPKFNAKDYQPPLALKRLAQDVAHIPDHTRNLISELEIQLSENSTKPAGNVVLYTIPARNGESVYVKMGKGGFAEKMNRLEAFWMQAIRTQPTKHFEYVDLRFDGQIVTKER